MNRRDLQGLAHDRLRDAEALFRSGQYSGSYYLAGYAIECALKAWIAKKRRRHEFPDKKLAVDAYVHDLGKLVALADPEKQLTPRLMSGDLAVPWRVVVEWKEESRYQRRLRREAHDLLAAVKGLLPCFEQYW